MTTRRNIIKTLSLAAGSIVFPHNIQAKKIAVNNISCQYYSWHTFYQRENKTWNHDLESAKALKAAGYNSYEPSFNHPDEVMPLMDWVNEANIKIHSFYVNSTLHEAAKADESIKSALSIAREAQKLGAKIVVTNPTPIRWGGEETKTDQELKIQAEKLEELGRSLKEMGLTLAYHTHDPEMKRGAREFHHMLVNTSPENVSLCLDTHWIFRGTGDSELALFDITKMYANRIVELHLRQSDQGIWSETFSPSGDINYLKLAEMIKALQVEPLLVIEQAVEKGTPNTIDAIKALSQSRSHAKQIFKDSS
ncbi:MAG: sugar phosphate isomerase/epimerase family protein [Candidatus Cyclobacteriaceae bacterium M3_2C_046]